MPLILAIEPDRRQASRIAALARAELKADLVIAESTERAVVTLNGRVPDLILTSPLLSPKDEADLRDLQSGASIQTLTIPVLAQRPGRAAQPSGLLGRLSWSRTTSVDATHGCDPAVFASQIAEYLQRAAMERASAAEDSQAAAAAAPRPTVSKLRELREGVRLKPDTTEDITGVRETAAAAAVPEEPAEPFIDSTIDDPFATAAASTEPEPVAELEATASTDVIELEVLSTATTTPDHPVIEVLSAATTEKARVADEWEEISLDDDAIELASETIDLQAFARELEATITTEAAHEPEASPSVALHVGADIAPAREVAGAELAPPRQILDDPIIEAFALEEAPQTFDDPVLEIEAAVAALEAPMPEAVVYPLSVQARWPPMQGSNVGEDDDPVVAEFVAGLQVEDAEAGAEPDDAMVAADPSDNELWMPLAPAGATLWPPLQIAQITTASVQDEWGFFDPDRCGFPALRAHLNHVAATRGDRDRRRTRTR